MDKIPHAVIFGILWFIQCCVVVVVVGRAHGKKLVLFYVTHTHTVANTIDN